MLNTASVSKAIKKHLESRLQIIPRLRILGSLKSRVHFGHSRSSKVTDFVRIKSAYATSY